ncbi:caspase family protein [Streptomyces mirabilis]|uniref:caspase family protein n=1 Tax=Streptomyces mirabilis TaxID=68239 RepID=UPI0033A3F17B
MTELSNPARSRALLIGAHSFTDPDLEPLPAVARNLDRLAELLRDPSVWGLDAGHLSVLAEPDRDQALGEAGRLADEAEDTLLVYYAGHGFVHDLSNELYLALPAPTHAASTPPCATRTSVSCSWAPRSGPAARS